MCNNDNILFYLITLYENKMDKQHKELEDISKLMYYEKEQEEYYVLSKRYDELTIQNNYLFLLTNELKTLQSRVNL
jgi:hypothetical protein